MLFRSHYGLNLGSELLEDGRDFCPLLRRSVDALEDGLQVRSIVTAAKLGATFGRD